MRINPQKHLGLVATLAAKFGNPQPGQELEELEEFGDGLDGLYHAIDHFKPRLGNKFSTYAYWCIRGFILKRKKMRKQRGSHKILALPEFEIATADQDRIQEQVDAKLDVETLLALFPRNQEKSKRALVGWFIEGKPLHELSEELGLCRERVRQRRDEALTYLRKKINRNRHRVDSLVHT